MRLSNPLLLASLGALLAAASCTLITDVDRSKIPDGQAGMPSGGDGPSPPQGGQPGMTGGTGSDVGGAPEGGAPEGGTANTPQGGAGGDPMISGGAGGVPGGAGNGAADAGMGGGL